MFSTIVGDRSMPFCQCLVLLAIIGIPWLWTHHSSLYLHHLMVFSIFVSMSIFPSSYRTSDFQIMDSPYSSMRTCMLSHFSLVQLFVIPRTVVFQAPLSMGFSRQEYRNGLPCPPPGDLPDQGIEPMSLKSPALAGEFFTTSATWELEICLGLF